jgi:ubiquinone/menaquinone biosynthesis C-methylase UbiE
MDKFGSKINRLNRNHETSDSHDVVADEFDRVAFDYESNRLSEWYKGHATIIMKALDDSLSGCLLDIGCGTGWLLRQIAKSQKHITAVGIDISNNMIDAARIAAAQENIANLEFIQGNWEDIDLSILSGKSISTVLCASTFHYFIDPGIAAKRMYESLNNGGHFFLLERDKADSPLTTMWDILHKYVIKDNVQFYHLSELTKFYQNAGFCNLLVQANIRKLFWKKKLYTNMVLLSGQKI